MNFLKNKKLYYLKDGVSAGSSINNNSDIIDMQDWEGVVFITPILACSATGVATMTVQQNTANSGTGMAALSGATATVTSASTNDYQGKLLAIDVYRPRERYLRVNRTSATANITYGDVIAILYSGRLAPVTQDTAEVAASTTVISPAEA